MSKIPILWVGIGCKKGTSRQLIEIAIDHVFQENQLQLNAICGIATIDSKAEEMSLIELCRARNWALKTFSADILATVIVPNASQTVAEKVFTPSVAEAAALRAVFDSPEHRLIVPKTIFRQPGEPGVVTLAIASAMLRRYIS